MKRIGALLILVTIFILYFFVIFPKNLGERSPIWELKERYLGDEYAELRTGYFISLRYGKLWYDYDVFSLGADSDIFSIKKVYLKVNEKIAKKCQVNIDGRLEWHKPDLHMDIYANVLSDEPLSVRVGADEYILDESEESICKYELETGMDANELLDTVHFIRVEYKAALGNISEAQYRKICAKIQKVILRLIVMWGIFILICGTIIISRKLYEKRIDKDMKDYIDSDNI